MKKTIKLLRKVKGILFFLRIDKIIPGRIFHFLANTADLAKWISVHRDCAFSDFYTSGFDYSKRESLYKYIIENQNLDTDIDYLEFGVSKGQSFRWWIEHIKNENARFYGFDTFSGLPEAWGPFKKGDMNNGNEQPLIDDNRHQFYQGLFQQTLTPFLESYKSTKRKVIHMDADLYSATLYVLTLITPVLNPGDIILFDEFNVPMHEFNAFNAWSNSFYVKYKVLGGVNNFYQVAIIIE